MTARVAAVAVAVGGSSAAQGVLAKPAPAPPLPPPRVLLLCQSLDLAGGVERFACALANHLAGQGFTSAIGSVDTPRAAVAYPLEPGVRLLTARPRSPNTDRPTTGLARTGRLIRNQWRTGRALAGLISAERPDVVILNGLTTACSVLLLHPGCAARAICCDHNHFDARSRPWRWLRARLYPRVAAIVSLTETDAPKFRALNRHTEVIANASALRRAAPPAHPSSPESALSLLPVSSQSQLELESQSESQSQSQSQSQSESQPTSSSSSPTVPPSLLLAIGRCVAQKGFDLLLQAWQQVLRRREVAARLRIVGDGPLREALMAESRRLGLDESVEWLPPTADIERHYQAADVFVLASRYEGLPLVLLEAQAMGLPAVAFDCPTGPAEIITPDTGILVPPQDVAALADALATLLAQPALRQRMGQAAWERSRSHFSPEAHLDRWTALIAAVAGQGAGPARHA